MEPDQALGMIETLCRRAFGDEATEIARLDDINRGRGAFSVVLRAELTWADGDTTDRRQTDGAERPRSVVAKLPMPGPNGEAARASGAYRRESLAYREVLADSPVAHPRAWAVLDGDDDDGRRAGLVDGTCALLLEDLSDQRAVDQLDGLSADDAMAVAASLADFHRAWDGPARSLGSAVRRNTLAVLPPQALDAGLHALEERWADVVGQDEQSAFAALASAHAPLVDRFDAAPVTLCHGDPRADNLAFERSSGRPILYDWQQIAIQFGEADLAWLAATSLTVETRRAIEGQLVESVGGSQERYRLGLALPGLAVLLLAQRELTNERTRRFVATSLQRIATAVIDNGTAGLGPR